jgi:Bacterial SH3 domain
MKLPRIETLVVIIFFLCIALWMIGKCGSRRSTDYKVKAYDTTEEKEERPAKKDTVVKYQAPPVTTPSAQPGSESMPVPKGAQAATPAPAATNTVAPKGTTPPVAKGVTAPTVKKVTPLYITIDGLKMRKQPGLKSETIATLKLFDEVEFLNQKTDWTQEISLGYEKVTDRWVKVRTKSGKEGWVFGAGVNYYKEKRKGVLE